MLRFWIVTLAVFCFSAGQSLQAANTFYVDPVNGSMAGDGSAASPWSTLQNVFSNNLIESQVSAVFPYNGTLAPRNSGAPVKSGDTIKLLNGFHGNVLARGYFNQNTITIEAETGHSPTLQGFHFQGAENWALRGLTVSPELGGTINGGSIVHFETHNWHGPASNLSIEDSTIYSATDTSAWTASDWNSKAGDGIKVSGENFVIRNNQLKNVDFGINTNGDDIVASSNTIENFAGDGMRGGGSRVTFEDNSIMWSYDVNGNHDDGIQFFDGFGVTQSDVVIRGNRIMTYPDPALPLTHAAQGIGNFDGPLVDWTVENNVIMTSTWHGIALYSSVNAQIVNNTVLDITGTVDPWINVTGSTNPTVRNNIAQAYVEGGATGVTFDHNMDISLITASTIFEDWQNGDLRLKAGSTAIDAGSGTLAPATDADGRPRPLGTAVDIGAFEYTLSSDFDSDSDVDGNDFLSWQRGNGLLSGAAPSDGDANADDAVDSQDVGIWQSQYGSTINGTLSSGSASVPEPTSCTLMLFAIMFSARRQRTSVGRGTRKVGSKGMSVSDYLLVQKN